MYSPGVHILNTEYYTLYKYSYKYTNYLNQGREIDEHQEREAL